MAQPAILRSWLAAAAVMLIAPLAYGQPAEPFFARKTITIYVGYTPGGSYDLYARLVARHLGKHVPGNPTVVAQNMPGAGSMKAANYIYQVAPKDGTALGVVVESASLEQVLGNSAVAYDAAKFTYVGRVATSNNVFMQWHTSKVQSIADSQKIESTLAGTGPGSIAETIPRLFNAIIGTKFRLVSGYPASTEGMLAMERGEVDGTGSSWAAVFVDEAEPAEGKEDQDHPADPARAPPGHPRRTEHHRVWQHAGGSAGHRALRQRQRRRA